MLGLLSVPVAATIPIGLRSVLIELYPRNRCLHSIGVGKKAPWRDRENWRPPPPSARAANGL